jgi:hypothetical protein
MRGRVFALVVAAALLGVAAGCGSSDNSAEGTLSTATITPASAFADGLCSAASTYKESVKSAASSLKGGKPTKGDVQGAVDDLTSATQKLVTDLKALDAPGTSDGRKARQAVSGLATELQTDLQAIKASLQAISSVADIPSVATTVSATLQAAQSEIAAAVAQLQALDPKSELQQAFQDSGACKSLSSSSG